MANKPTKVTPTDPFDFPKSMIPLGMTYQWQSKTVVGEPDRQYNQMIADGWVPVQKQWHPLYYKGEGPVIVKGNVLLCHAAAKDEEAERITGAQKNLEEWGKKFGGAGISGGVRMSYQDSRGSSPVKQVAVGDADVAKKIAPPQEAWTKSVPPTPVAPQPLPAPPIVEPPAVQVKKPPFLKWLIGFFSREKKS